MNIDQQTIEKKSQKAVNYILNVKFIDLIVEKLDSVKNQDVDYIAKNNPLKENLLTLFVCVFSRTPLFLCGKPGSSKTLSANWFIKAFQKKNHSEEKESNDEELRIYGFPFLR